jgi:hypothetical protein
VLCLDRSIIVRTFIYVTSGIKKGRNVRATSGFGMGEEAHEPQSLQNK